MFAADRVRVTECALPHPARQVKVDVVEMNVLDPPRGQLDHLAGVGARDDQVRYVEADARLRADEQPLDLLWPLDRAAKPGLHGELELVPRAHVLDRSDEVEQVGPLRIRQKLRANRIRAALG